MADEAPEELIDSSDEAPEELIDSSELKFESVVAPTEASVWMGRSPRGRVPVRSV